MGLGPTSDDLTSEAVFTLNQPLVKNEKSEPPFKDLAEKKRFLQ